MQGPVDFCIHNASVTGGSYWPVCGPLARSWLSGQWTTRTQTHHLTHTRINIISPSACSHTRTHEHAHNAFYIINKWTTACDAKQQHAVAMLASPASGHCNESFFFLPANVIDTHAEETGPKLLHSLIQTEHCAPTTRRVVFSSTYMITIRMDACALLFLHILKERWYGMANHGI